MVGLANWRKGDVEQAATRIRESLRIKVQIDDLAGEAHCAEVLAWVAASAGDMRRAARLFGVAYTFWQKVGSSLVEFAYFQRFRNPIEQQVRNALGDDVYGTLFHKGEQMDLTDAIDCLLERKVSRPMASAARESESMLTPREREVAELVGQGLSNKQIAAHLVIAQRTAEGHVERILAKVGFSSRAQIATWVAEGRDGN